MPSISIRHKLKQKWAFIIVNGPFAGVSDGLFGCDDVHAVDLGGFSVSNDVGLYEGRGVRMREGEKGKGGREKEGVREGGR